MNKELDKYLSYLGLKFPETDSDMKAFTKGADGYEYQLDEKEINPENIIKSVKEEEKKNKEKSNFKSRSFFKRVVLAAKIADEYHVEPTFGSVKFQKVMFLCENASKMKFSTNYTKQAAGPMDTKFQHSIKPELRKQGWFEVVREKSGNFTREKYRPLTEAKPYLKHYDNYYSEVSKDIVLILDTFRKWKTKDVELVATVYACWLDADNKSIELSESYIIDRVFKWHESKKDKYSEGEIVKMFDWMKENNLYPNP